MGSLLCRAAQLEHSVNGNFHVDNVYYTVTTLDS
jgi:hypothetical protein